jgi:hypothetical protein
VQHAALQVVVDLGEVHRRAGDGEVEPVERCVLEQVEHLLRGRGLLVERGVALQHDAADRGAVDRAALDVGERALQRLADHELFLRWRNRGAVDDLEAAVVEDQELVVLGVGDHLLLAGDRTLSRASAIWTSAWRASAPASSRAAADRSASVPTPSASRLELNSSDTSGVTTANAPSTPRVRR